MTTSSSRRREHSSPADPADSSEPARGAARPRGRGWPRRSLGRRIALAAAVVVLVAAAVTGWAMTRSPASTGPSYRVVPAVRTTLTQTASASGAIEPKKTETLSFSASGKVTSVRAKPGQRVRKGQVLATMYSASLRAQVAQAKASLAGAQSQLAADEASGASSAQLAADGAAVQAARSQVKGAEAALRGARLTSPIKGIVTAVGLTAGEQVAGGSGSGSGGSGSGSGGSGSGSGGSGSGSGAASEAITVVTVSDVVDISVDAAVVSQIKAGDQAMIITEGAAGPVTGTVASIGLIADTSSGVATFPVVVNVTGVPKGLYPGASATVSIVYNQRANVLAVPTAALRFTGGRTVVDTLVNGRRVPRAVTIGLTSGGLTQITSGLSAGEQVVVDVSHPRGAVTGPGPGNGRFFVGPGKFQGRPGGPGPGGPGGPGGVVQIGPGG